jgi:predicted nucleic acid-binding protein
MSRRFVLDSSVTMTWFFEDEATPATDALLDQLTADAHAVVPAHWALEVSNTLLMGERRKRCTVAESTHFLGILNGLQIETDQETIDRAGSTSLALARAHGLTLYDGAYLELAMRSRLPLATLDRGLRAAAMKTGVPCLPEVGGSVHEG